MSIDFRKWFAGLWRQKNHFSKIKLGKVYLLLGDDESYDFVINMAYTKTGFLGLNVQHIEKDQRMYILKNIFSITVSKQKLKQYEMRNIKFITEIEEKDYSILEALPTKRGN